MSGGQLLALRLVVSFVLVVAMVIVGRMSAIQLLVLGSLVSWALIIAIFAILATMFYRLLLNESSEDFGDDDQDDHTVATSVDQSGTHNVWLGADALPGPLFAIDEQGNPMPDTVPLPNTPEEMRRLRNQFNNTNIPT